ncbi:MAG: MBL fold metallo-hydrolase [Candidatus Heimdallarchaeota archaeon]|nr:MBL fold metallo-hydrolase [Candidatus Heimdallarchaeota archaeon]
MESYQIVENLYRIPGGYGKNGEVFGGVFIRDDPGVLIGASGGKVFVRNLIEIVNKLGLHGFRVYLTHITLEEINTLELIRDEYPDVTFYIHESIAPLVKEPRESFLDGRYGTYNEESARKLQKRLPKKIDNIVEVGKGSSFQTENTKILIIPFQGPQKGHTFVYSTAQKLLCTGLVGGYSSTDKRVYYLDMTGSLMEYSNAFSFLKQAESEIVFSAYDEPHMNNQGKYSPVEVENALERDKENIYELCTLKPKTINEILAEFRRYHTFTINTPPYNEIKLDATIIEFYLKILLHEGKIITKDNTYKRK